MVCAVPSPRLHRVETVPGTYHRYVSIGTTCKAYFPNDKNGATYFCNHFDSYNQTRCNDVFFVDAPKGDERNLLDEAAMLGGLYGPGVSSLDLLYKLQAARL